MATSGYRERCLEEKGEECSICGAEEDICVHHRDGDRGNNDIENLVPLCKEHHGKIHNGDGEYGEYVEPLPDRAVNEQGGERAQITLRVSSDTLEQIETNADKRNLSRSAIIRRYLNERLDGLDAPSEAELLAKEREVERLEDELEYVKSIVDRLISDA